MSRAERIENALKLGLKPIFLRVEDQSSRHAGHAGARPEGETHYHILVESAALSGLNRVQRHQAVYALLANEFATGLHALSLEAFAPGERVR